MLREVNRILTDRGADALYELPQGTPGTGTRCVIARALGEGVVVSPYGVWYGTGYGDLATRDVKFDPATHPLRRFVVAFDCCEYPELIAP